MVMDDDPANYFAASGDVCDTLGNPVALTFQYSPSTMVDTDQDPGKAEILFDSGMVDDDGISFVVVTDQSDPVKALAADGKQFFRGDVAIDATFEANEDTDSFGSTTYIHFFDEASGGLLQSVEYHTSCSQPIRLGDVIGNATLVAYVGENGSLPPVLRPSSGLVPANPQLASRILLPAIARAAQSFRDRSNPLIDGVRPRRDPVAAQRGPDDNAAV